MTNQSRKPNTLQKHSISEHTAKTQHFSQGRDHLTDAQTWLAVTEVQHETWIGDITTTKYSKSKFKQNTTNLLSIKVATRFDSKSHHQANY